MKRLPRVLFFGMQGQFSLPILHALLKNSIEVCAIVLPAPAGNASHLLAIYQREQSRSKRSLLPMLHATLHNNIMHVAWERHIPLWEVTRLADAETASMLAAYQPDCICVACFSQRIPESILAIPPLGCLNVHPSLLPANRGPEPLFWTFHQGLKQTGVTIHLMDRGMDTGDVLKQEVLAVPDGISYAQLEQLCALGGGELLAQTVYELFEGRGARVPQDEAKSSYQPFPSEEDYIVPVADWNVKHVYNFICGLADRGEPIKLQVGDAYVPVTEAISYSHINDEIFHQRDYGWWGSALMVRCKDGWVAVTSSATSQ